MTSVNAFALKWMVLISKMFQLLKIVAALNTNK